jgi:hypothetical protein
MLYTELVKQAADLAGVMDFYSESADSTSSARIFTVLQTSLLALNTDDRLTFAVEDITLPLVKPKLVLTPSDDYEAGDGEQVLKTDYPVEIPPAYVLAHGRVKMRHTQFENHAADKSDIYAYAMRIEYGKATLFFRYAGELKIGLKKPLDMPKLLTDEVKIIGSALNLVKYKLATEICAVNGFGAAKELEQKYSEYIARHAKQKADILPPPVLR